MPDPKPHVLHVGFSEAFQSAIDFENYTVTVLLHRYRVERLSGQTLQQFARIAVFDTADPSDMEGYENEAQQLVRLADAFAAEFGPPEAVVGLFEHTVRPAALLRDHFGLPGTGFGTALLFRDKVAMKQALRGSEVRVPRFWAVDATTRRADMERIARELPGRVVLKPRGQAASIGVRIFDTAADLLAYGETVGFEDGYEVEEFVEGLICHMDGVIRDGLVRFLSVSHYVGTCLGFQVEHTPLASVTFDDPHVVAKAADFASSVLQRLGLRNSSFHLEAFLTSGGDFVFLEVACRFGGAGVPRQLRLVYGFDIVEESLLACMQLPSRWRGAGTVLGTLSVGASGWLYMPVPGETRSRVRGVHGLDARPDSVIFAEIPNVGEVLDPAGFYTSSGKFVLSGAGTESVERDLRRIMDTYAVDVEPLPHAA